MTDRNLLQAHCPFCHRQVERVDIDNTSWKRAYYITLHCHGAQQIITVPYGLFEERCREAIYAISITKAFTKKTTIRFKNYLMETICVITPETEIVQDADVTNPKPVGLTSPLETVVPAGSAPSAEKPVKRNRPGKGLNMVKRIRLWWLKRMYALHMKGIDGTVLELKRERKRHQLSVQKLQQEIDDRTEVAHHLWRQIEWVERPVKATSAFAGGKSGK